MRNQQLQADQRLLISVCDTPSTSVLTCRGFSINMDSVLDDEEPLYTSGSLQVIPSLPGGCCVVFVVVEEKKKRVYDVCGTQPVRGPGDLRHDLERRRLERLEGVKVTICGSNAPQRIRWVERVCGQSMMG